MQFRCATCQQLHDTSTISFGWDSPLQWMLISDEERKASSLSGEQCCIVSSKGRSQYIRCQLEVPVAGRRKPFAWGVWCSLSESSMAEMIEHWDDPGRTGFGPYFGWLSTVIPVYPDTAFLKTHVVQRAVGKRPCVLLEETDHPLSVDQRQGISEDRLAEIIQTCLHGGT